MPIRHFKRKKIVSNLEKAVGGLFQGQLGARKGIQPFAASPTPTDGSAARRRTHLKVEVGTVNEEIGLKTNHH